MEFISDIKNLSKTFPNSNSSFTTDLLSDISVYDLVSLFDTGGQIIVNFRPDDFSFYSEQFKSEDNCNYVSYQYMLKTLNMFFKQLKAGTEKIPYSELASIIQVKDKEEKELLKSTLLDIGLFEYPPEVKRNDLDTTYLTINTKPTQATTPTKFYFNDDDTPYIRGYAKIKSVKDLLEDLKIIAYLNIELQEVV
jgi:hypothetical protein